MRRAQSYTDEGTPTDLDVIEPGPQLSLLIIGDGFISTHPLPDSGELILGRGQGADVTIDITSVSRRHARLHLGDTIRIEDLGSANGTFVDERRLEPRETVPLTTGAVFELGSTMLIVQDRHTAGRPRRVWTHGYFEARLEDECARAERSSGRFSLLRVRADSKRDRTLSLHEILRANLRPGDILASYGPDDYEILVVDAAPSQARELVERISDRMRAEGVELRTGMASYPADGRVPEALMARACAEIDSLDRSEDTSVGIVVEAAVMKNLHRLVERVATSDINVLILGETGVGKEVFAERLHTLSARRDAPLLRLNCASLNEDLLESELFGHERGAFTGAVAAKPGLLEAASGGTVFLDEVGDMPASLQAKLLRVLEAGQVRRVGGLEDRTIDIRVVAATHVDLEAEVREGRFRQDLFFRINGMSLVVPPLRDRTEEIAPLARSFVARACKRQRKPPMRLDDAALRAMRRYEWPGNIRELRNIVERAVVLCTGTTITLDHLPGDKLASTFEMCRMATGWPPPVNGATTAPARTADGQGEPVDLRRGIDERERELIKDALARASGNQTRAARSLGISRRTLISRIAKHGLPRPRKGRRG